MTQQNNCNLKLSDGHHYSLKVLEITQKQKKIKKADQNLYNIFKVKLQDKDGNICDTEYVTRSEDVSDVFVKGAYQWIRCGIVGTTGIVEIEPADDPGNGLQHRGVPNRAALSDPKQSTQEPNSFSVPVLGKSFTFAMGYAKDLLAAEVAVQTMGYKITDEDIERMIGWADKINNGICERMQF